MVDASPPAKSPNLPAVLFGLSAPVSRATYLAVGVVLMLLKYALDTAAIYASSGQWYAPWRFLSPLWSTRIPDHAASFQGLIDTNAALVAMAAWALVFMWVGVSMSIRRAVDAGQSGWFGLLFMLPLLNLLVIAVLAALPSSENHSWVTPKVEPYRTAGPQPQTDAARMPSALRSALIGVAGGLGIGAFMVATSVYLLGSYGMVLFFLTPFMMGAVGGYVFNQHESRNLMQTAIVGLTIIIITGLGMALLALEGAICIAMAAPLAVPVGVFGAFIGRALAAQSNSAMHHAALAVLALPALAGTEATFVTPPTTEVISVIEVDAPPEQVWPHVIGFSELPQPRRAIFDAGIAYPMRARIEGSGVGAVRYCEFSTGPFVEPITHWEPPTRLSFDVAEQPHAMKEWSPFANVYPPHLDDSIRSQRGEFRLIRLPGNRTRLEGSTWYQLNMYPANYWRFWSDTMIHAIHVRVLDHVKNLSEGDGDR